MATIIAAKKIVKNGHLKFETKKNYKYSIFIENPLKD